MILVYDITKRRSFEHLEDWLEEVKIHIEPNRAAYLVVGHKADRDAERAITYREGKRFAEFHGLKFLETSAKSGMNVEECFLTVSRDIYDMLDRGQISVEEGWDGIKAGYSRPKEAFHVEEGQPEGGGCC